MADAPRVLLLSRNPRSGVSGGSSPMASAGRGGGGRPRGGSRRAHGHGGSPGHPCPPAPHSALRERDRVSGQGRCPYQHCLLTPAQRPWQIPRRAGWRARACRESTASSRRAGDGAGAQRAGVSQDPGCRAAGGLCRGVPTSCESLLHQTAGEAALLLLFAQLGPGCGKENGGVGGASPPSPSLAGTEGCGQPVGTRPSREPLAKVTEGGTQECPQAAERTWRIFSPPL